MTININEPEKIFDIFYWLRDSKNFELKRPYTDQQRLKYLSRGNRN
jgi:hypothetical protein